MAKTIFDYDSSVEDSSNAQPEPTSPSATESKAGSRLGKKRTYVEYKEQFASKID